MTVVADDLLQAFGELNAAVAVQQIEKMFDFPALFSPTIACSGSMRTSPESTRER